MKIRFDPPLRPYYPKELIDQLLEKAYQEKNAKDIRRLMIAKAFKGTAK